MALPIQAIDPRGIQLSGMVARDAYERWLAGEVMDVLDAAFRELVHRLIVDVADLTVRDRQGLAGLFAEVDRQLSAAYGEVAALTDGALTAYAGVEADAATHYLRTLIGAADVEGRVTATGSLLARPVLESIARLPIQGLSLGEWWASQASAMSQATRRAIQTGLVLGESSRDITRRIVPAPGSVEPAVWRRAQSAATAVVRTSMTAVHADAALATYSAMGGDISGEYELVTARDARVSAICRALDGQRFRYDDPKRKVPPFHIHCRTTIVPVVNYRTIGLTPPPAVQAGGLTFRSYDAWLRQQPKSTQNEILGPARAEWYRNGRFTLRDLVDSDNRVLTLAQLRSRIAS